MNHQRTRDDVSTGDYTWGFLLLCLAALWVPANAVSADDFMESGEISAVAGGTLLVFGIGEVIADFDSTRPSLAGGPLPGEESFQRWLGGTPTSEPGNFLNGDFGYAITPVVAGISLIGAGAGWPRQEGNADQEVIQDMFLFTAGLAATRGITALCKGLFARPRPLLTLAPEVADRRMDYEYAYDHSSFFSGHTSSAFFACAFLNLRARSIMRSEMSADEYRRWRWAPPTLLFGWSSFVGMSRVEAYKHYLSDIVAGAVVGTLLAELFFNFAANPVQRMVILESGTGTPLLLRVGYRF